MKGKVKLGVVGTNFVSSWLCEAARTLDGIELAALYSRSVEKGSAFAVSEGVGAVYTELDRFFASGIEAVYLASPTYCHFEMAKAALMRGLHVLVEKPIVTSCSELDELISLARSKNLVLMEAMRPQYDGSLSAVRDALPALGRVRSATFEFCQYSSRYDAFRRGEVLNAFTPEISGGALFDIGIYPLFWVIALFGRPETVTASSTFLENGFEGGGTALLGYGDFQVSVIYSKICQSITPSVIRGEVGALTVDKLTQPDQIMLILRGKEPRELSHPHYDNNLVCELAAFSARCRGESRGDGDLALTHLVYETLERICVSAGLDVSMKNYAI